MVHRDLGYAEGKSLRVERAEVEHYGVYLKGKSRPPSRGGNSRAWHQHVLMIGGKRYSFLATWSGKFVYKGETVSFDWDWDKDQRYRNVDVASVVAWKPNGEQFWRGERSSKTWRTAYNRLPARRSEWKDLTEVEHDSSRSLADGLAAIALPNRAEPFVLPCPAPAMAAAFLSFTRMEDWRAFVLRLDLDPRIPLVVHAKFARALRVLYLAWIDFDLIKAAELVGITALELALKDRFPGPGKPPAFGTQLRLLVERDGLTDADIPI